ncbi:carbohydrate-binding module family 14 protein [Streptomyces sp. H27-G5]|uniref:carbohydrate-binding module family 14 protein n=1 Tax=Streptomyces sp. H27-G5 TaxID=2996698 RepID=UPI002271B844|nr:carbohydrate-binding module family 14 protein [Streptomyces sp. H27-G5]MCY0924047.1 carbohydrate-binding module family 14 protein [Streptomyces sp. H27-G5]
MNKILTSLALSGIAVLAAASAAGAQQPAAFQEPVPFSCEGRADGNYPHPSNPTKFMACVAQEYAYEQSCFPSYQGEMTYYVASVDACLTAAEASERSLPIPF